MFLINRKNYEKILSFLRGNTFCRTAVKIVYGFLPLVIFAGYPVMLGFVWFLQPDKFLRILCIPALVFLIVTILRKAINRKRPYEKYKIPSLFGKSSSGESMPSRHTACAFIISMAALYAYTRVGCLFLALSILIAASRILSGVHYVGDVLAGAGISILFGIVFFFIL